METRKRMPNIEAVRTATHEIRLSKGQCFFQTPKAYEIWEESPLHRVFRIANNRIFWVFEKAGDTNS